MIISLSVIIKILSLCMVFYGFKESVLVARGDLQVIFSVRCVSFLYRGFNSHSLYPDG